MPLDPTTRGVLDQIIDGIITDIPKHVRVIYDPSQKAKFLIENEHDFLFGICLGSLYNSFAKYFISRFKRYPNEEEALEIQTVIFKRMAEIRNAIYQGV